MSTALHWVCFSSLTLIRLLICAVIIYYANQFYKLRYERAIEKRHPYFTLSFTICCLIFLGIDRTFLDLAYIYDSYDTQINAMQLEQQNIGHIFKLVWSIFYAFGVHGSVIFVAARAWIIYFDIKWALQSQKQEWSIHLDPTQTAESAFWFIRHRQDYGSHKFIKTVVLSYYLFQALCWLLMLFFGALSMLINAIDSILFLIELSCIVIIWIRIPSFYDAFGVKEELRYVLICGGSALFVYILWVISRLIVGDNALLFFISELSATIFVGAMAIIFNAFILRSKKYSIWQSDLQLAEFITEKESPAGITAVTLLDTLNDEKLIGEFFTHLLKTFSVELLLSYIEFCHFKQLMERDDDFMKGLLQTQQTCGLSQTIPSSYIVSDKYKGVSSNVERYLLIAEDLYRKYIEHSTEFQINIRYDTREQIASFFNECAIDGVENVEYKHKLYTLFDKCSSTVYSLMSSSFEYSKCIRV